MRVIASLIVTAVIIIIAWALVAHSQSQSVTTSCNDSYTTCTTTGY